MHRPLLSATQPATLPDFRTVVLRGSLESWGLRPARVSFGVSERNQAVSVGTDTTSPSPFPLSTRHLTRLPAVPPPPQPPGAERPSRLMGCVVVLACPTLPVLPGSALSWPWGRAQEFATVLLPTPSASLFFCDEQRETGVG